jgi:hypothetical protein
MRADEHTGLMLRWWEQAGVERVDLAVRRPSGAMIWHRDDSVDSLPLGWARAENARGAEVYVRPSRGYRWPMVFLDDLPLPRAVAIARKYDALVVHTSPVGGCHLWLCCTVPLAEEARGQVQRWLAARCGADPASTSGEHLGRLAGFKNWKRAGTWVNVVEASHGNGPFAPRLEEGRRHPRRTERFRSTGGHLAPGEGVDTSESGREWGFICGLLEDGCDASAAYSRLLEHARLRRGRDAERYAQRTVSRALDNPARAGRTL